MIHLFLTHKANPASFILTAGAIMLLALVAFSNVTRADVKTFIVNTDADPTDPNLAPQHCMSLCTLRVAIGDAEAHPNDPSQPDVIIFNIPGAGVHTIVLAFCLPIITDPVIIDGWSQDGFTNTTPNIPLIALDGRNASGGCSAFDGLTITAGKSTVLGLIINRFGSGAGIVLQDGGDNIIAGNYIGTDSSGTLARSNLVGILIDNSPNNTIGANDHTGTCDKSCNVISGNSQEGIRIQGSGAKGNVILGNFIGPAVNGTVALGNVNDGVFVSSGTPGGVTIGGPDHDAGKCNKVCNLISGNGRHGIELASGNGIGTTPSSVEGNFIGTDKDGSCTPAPQDLQKKCPLGNLRSGVLISNTPANTILRNLISGNRENGVFIFGSSATANVVQGNVIGTNATGNAQVRNNFNGVEILDASVNSIGGTDSGARNLISGNSGHGVFIHGSGAQFNKVQGNFIGTDITGELRVPNSVDGVSLGASNNLVGGTVSGAGNLISANINNGVSIGANVNETFPTNGNEVQGNKIGISQSGQPLGNSNGVEILAASSSSANNNTIGGKAPGAGNTIAFNDIKGVDVSNAGNNAVLGNAILGNSIFSNKSLGIDLVPNGVNGETLNDIGDPDSGPNNLQNFPDLTSATSDGNGLTITGGMNTLANTTIRIEFFVNTTCHSSGYGQGEKFIGSKSVTTDNTGNINNQGNPSFTLHASGDFSSYKFLTATATTDPGNDTSEFSQCIPIKSTTGCQGTIAPPNSRSASPAAPPLFGSSTALPPPRAIQAACTPDTSLLQTDDGSFEQPIGFPNGASTAYFVNRIAPPISARYPFKLQKLEIFFGNRSNGLAVNTPITLLVGTNDTGGSNINGITFSRFATTVGFLNQWNVYDLSQIADPNLVLASGDFVVGFEVNDPPNVFPADQDTSSSSRGRSYISTDGTNFSLIDSFGSSLAGNFGIRAEILPVFAEGEICNNLTLSVKPSGSPKPVIFKATAKKAAKQTFSVTVTNKTGIAQTVSNLDALLGEPFTIVSISPATPRTIKNGKKQTFTVKTQRAAGLGTATATAPFFFTQTSCGLLIPAGRLAQAVPFDSQGVRLELQEGQLRLQVGGTGMESVRLELFDLSGRKLLDRADANGLLSLPIAMDDGAPLANGVYLYVITGRSQQGEMMPSQVRKLVIRR
ncbi:hypothetical protein HYR54_10550 [Candidatus Acetothermia bacterium]|nr:hypothetical protein [Candidatus Acetothermia bacterium]MBI3459982.1 hypothetical protein [Candidatus Acetothermia bacterium]